MRAGTVEIIFLAMIHSLKQKATVMIIPVGEVRR